MLITRRDYGDFGLKQSLGDAFETSVVSPFDNVSEEHGLTDDGKTVPPCSWISIIKRKVNHRLARPIVN